MSHVLPAATCLRAHTCALQMAVSRYTQVVERLEAQALAIAELRQSNFGLQEEVSPVPCHCARRTCATRQPWPEHSRVGRRA